MIELKRKGTGLREFPWRISYRTSAVNPDGSEVDILHDFYMPALHRSVRYDRVAGYFRSTSLAAASQGFSAFVGNEGKMRLIVRADLDLTDVKAILAGSKERFESTLKAELAHPETWPEEVTHGVELLSWMVAKGYLEVKVAFRVHARTGEPLLPDAVDDGYVHMKWGLFSDAEGNRIYISGSLNESRTSLTLNAENIDVHCEWYGETEKQRVQEAEDDFELLWKDQNPALRVLPLPEAVQQNLIKIAEGLSCPVEIDGSSAAPREVPPPSALERLRFALLKDGPRLPGGKYVGMATVPIEPWPHQEVVARRLISTWPYNYLLCDEVGLGKTIEAGLAIRSLYLSGLVKRALICAPASLTQQWHREMASKFLLPFGRALGGVGARHEYILPFGEVRQASSTFDPGLTIVSTGLLIRSERISELKGSATFGITLVDEAHYARRRNPTQGSRGNPEYGNLFRVIQTHLLKKSESLLLATATPMQLDPVEAADLMRLTRRVGPYQFDPGLMNFFYHALGSIVSGNTIGEREWDFLLRTIEGLRDQDPLFWEFIEKAVVDGPTRIALRQWLQLKRPPRGSDRDRVMRLIFTSGPLSRVMQRHRRSLLEIYKDEGRLHSNLPEREVLPIPRIVFTDQEREAYEELEHYCKGLAAQLAEQRQGRGKSAIGFILSFLRLRFASSLYAIRETLRRRLEKVEATTRMLQREQEPESDEFDPEELLEDSEDDAQAIRALLRDRGLEDLEWEKEQLQRMLQTLADLSGHSSKMTELLKLLDRRKIRSTGRIRQTVIFTRFFDTLTDIVDRLRRTEPTILIGTYSGRGGQYFDPKSARLMGVNREEVKQRFLREEIDILICTDAAAEGLNLQTADFLVNFDLPWNPMKVEQRIGRVDRIGQRHQKVFVLNLCYADSVEQIVYGRLLRRLSEAGAVVGTQQISLLPVTREEFQQLAEGRLSEGELEARAVERAFLAKKRTASMEIPPRDLYTIYLRLSEQSPDTTPPVDLENIWETLKTSTYLRDLGCTMLPDPEKRTIILSGIPDIPERTALTASRETYEIGIPERREALHFATYGDQVFESLLVHLGSFELPPCIRRIEAEVPDLNANMVSYCVAEAPEKGNGTCKFVQSFRDLADLHLSEAAELSDEEIESATNSLVEIAEREFSGTRAAARIEQLNEEAARSQLFLNLLVVKDLIKGRLIQEQAEQSFWTIAAGLERICEEREVLRARIPISLARRLSHLLFDITIPSAGEYAFIDAPKALLTSSLEAAYRLANSMKMKKAQLTTELFLGRLDREVERITKQ
jgi:hypothetical protein